jgi:hypothetical protein
VAEVRKAGQLRRDGDSREVAGGGINYFLFSI